jgi:hypothetical protein
MATSTQDDFVYVPSPGRVARCTVERLRPGEQFEHVTVEVIRDRREPNERELAPDRIEATVCFVASTETVNAVQLNALRQAVIILEATIKDLETRGHV